MKHLGKLSQALLWVTLILIAMAPMASAQSTVAVTFSWTAPTTGSPVNHYVVQISVNGGPFSQIAAVGANSYTLTASIGSTYIMRVAGVDAENRQGPWSPESEPYTPDLGPPGQPGKPVPLF